VDVRNRAERSGDEILLSSTCDRIGAILTLSSRCLSAYRRRCMDRMSLARRARFTGCCSVRALLSGPSHLYILCSIPASISSDRRDPRVLLSGIRANGGMPPPRISWPAGRALFLKSARMNPLGEVKYPFAVTSTASAEVRRPFRGCADDGIRNTLRSLKEKAKRFLPS
jgi:hypothetical protein